MLRASYPDHAQDRDTTLPRSGNIAGGPAAYQTKHGLSSVVEVDYLVAKRDNCVTRTLAAS